MNLIETFELTKRFDHLMAVDGLTLRVPAGEVLALLGPNGAGKTTTIRMLASILRPTSGTVIIAGHDVAQDPVEVRRSVGLLTEHHGLYTRMKPREYLRFFGRAYGLAEDVLNHRIEALCGHYDLEQAMDRRLGEFSKGMRQKLALVRALLHDPPVLLLDEPTSAMDPSNARLVREGIVGLRSADRAIVVCTHNLTEAENLADRIAIIQRGRIVAEGSPRELKRALLGDPIMELTLACPLDGVLKLLPKGLEPVSRGENWLRYRTARPELVNPRLLAQLTEAGIPVLTLAEVSRSLEDIYLQVIGGEAMPLERGQR
ncbi:MAG: ABC transporter ATP-binding protein [Chloroflexota bacterium]